MSVAIYVDWPSFDDSARKLGWRTGTGRGQPGVPLRILFEGVVARMGADGEVLIHAYVSQPSDSSGPDPDLLHRVNADLRQWRSEPGVNDRPRPASWNRHRGCWEPKGLHALLAVDVLRAMRADSGSTKWVVASHGDELGPVVAELAHTFGAERVATAALQGRGVGSIPTAADRTDKRVRNYWIVEARWRAACP